MNSLTEIQKQIRSFNKAYKRAIEKGTLKGDFLATTVDLVDYERMTMQGYAKAGTKFLENLSYKDLLAYQSDIKQAKGVIELVNVADKIDIAGAKDWKSLLWKLYDKIDTHKSLDSDQIYAAVEGIADIDYKKLALELYKYDSNPNYGQSDFDEWFNEQAGIEWQDKLEEFRENRDNEY